MAGLSVSKDVVSKHLEPNTFEVEADTLAKVPATKSIEETFAELPWDDLWADGAICEVCCYLRGGRRLQLPDSWRAVIPNSFTDA